jgi:hypothetical protein
MSNYKELKKIINDDNVPKLSQNGLKNLHDILGTQPKKRKKENNFIKIANNLKNKAIRYFNILDSKIFMKTHTTNIYQKRRK